MMKKVCLIIATTIAAAAAEARLTTLWEDDFSTYSGDLLTQGPWNAQETGFTITDNALATGGKELHITGSYLRAPMSGLPIENLRPGYSIQIVVDHRLSHDITANPGYFEVGLTGATNAWQEGWLVSDGWLEDTPTIGSKVEYNNYAEGTVKYYPNKEYSANNDHVILAVAPAYCGFQPNHEGAPDTESDRLRYTLTITKLETTNEFSISGEFENLDTGVTLSKTAPNVVNANAWDADEVYVFIKSLQNRTAGKETDVYVDRVAVFQGKSLIPRTAVLWEDDFSDIADDKMQIISSRPGWQLNNNHSGWAVTNGIAIQRPNITEEAFASGVNGRGAIRTDNPFAPAAGETMQMEFDWTLYTDGPRNNFNLINFGVQTNIWTDGVWDNRLSVWYNSPEAAMSFQFVQKDDGTMLPQFADNEVSQDLTPIPLTFFGVNPETGDDVGDIVRVTYRAEKSTVENEWNVSLSFENTISGATYAINEITVVNAVTYNHNAFYFTQIFPFANDVGLVGHEFNNFKASQLGMPGYDGWAKRNWPSKDLGDPLADYDGNGMINLLKYTFGGDPTMATDKGLPHTMRVIDTENGKVIEYVYSMVADAESGISTYMETVDNKIHGTWENVDWEIAGISEEVNGFITVTNHIYILEQSGFARLQVEME